MSLVDYTCYLDTYYIKYNTSDGRQIYSTTTADNGPGTNSVKLLFKKNILLIDYLDKRNISMLL
jgi:hypothetical protein